MKIAIAGDFSPRATLNEACKRLDKVILTDIMPLVSDCQFKIVNFETTIDTPEAKPIKKNGPALKSCEESVAVLKSAGFNVLTLANNHILDYSSIGLEHTLNVIRANGLPYVGVGSDLKSASETLYLESEGETLAIINCCENEFSIATDKTAGANPLNPIQQYYAIKEAREKADYIVVITHGGHEYFQLPSPRMQETYRFFIDAGADALVNHHQHCYSGYEVYNGKPIFYGIGNFCFDKKNINAPHSEWNDGFIVKLDLKKGSLSYELIPYIQCLNEPKVTPLINRKDFDSCIERFNEIIANPQSLKSKIEEYYDSLSRGKMMVFQPSRNRFILSATYRNLLPLFLSQKHSIIYQNNIDCESHRDVILHALKKFNM